MAQQDDPNKSIEWRLENMAAKTWFHTHKEPEPEWGAAQEAMETLKQIIRDSGISSMAELDRKFTPDQQREYLNEDQQFELTSFMMREVEKSLPATSIGQTQHYHGRINTHVIDRFHE